MDLDLIIDLKWRLELEPDVRPKQVDRILVNLIFFFPNCVSKDLDELVKMAEWLEEDSFIEAKSYIEYLDKIYVRVQKMVMRFPTTNEPHVMQPKMHIQGQQLLSQNVQNTIVSAGTQRSASLPSALPSMPSLTQSSVPNVAGLKMQSGIAKNMSQQFSSQEQQLLQRHQLKKPNLLQPTRKSKAVSRSTNTQSKTAHAQQQQRQQLMKQNLLQSTGKSKAVGQSTNTQSETAHAQQQQRQQLMKQNLLQSTGKSKGVGRSTNTQSETAHAQQQQGQQLMKQNLLQSTGKSKAVGRSTNTQSEIAHAQQHQLMSNPQLFSSSMNSIAQTGQNADAWKEEIYQEMLAIKLRLLPYLKEIYQKTFKECQHLKRNDSVSNLSQCERQKLSLLETLEGHMRILNVSKDSVVPTMKGNLSIYEEHVLDVIRSNWPQEPVSTQQQIQQPGGHSLSAQPQQQQEEVDNQPRKP